MLTILHPQSNRSERSYVLHQVFHDWLGLDVQLVVGAREDTLIHGPDGSEGPQLRIADGLLGSAPDLWLTPSTLPSGAPVALAGAEALECARLVEPVLVPWAATTGATTLAMNGERFIDINADLFGAIFLFLSRYEEVAAPAKDRFGRYPFDASYVGRHGLVERPLVDEYVAVLRTCLLRLWPQLALRDSRFRVEVSHDVDLPLRHAWASPLRMAGGGIRDLVNGGGVGQLSRRVSDWHAVRHRAAYDRDPYNTFNELMAHSDTAGRPAAFYFIADRPAGNVDCLYTLDHPFIFDLIGRLHRAGHEIGLHPSFNTYLDADRIKSELTKLQSVCERAQVRQARWGGRQHYLRWQAPYTWHHWEAAGLHYDSTLAFAQHIGFRCGTSREFQVYDLLERRPLKLLERPLVVMDTTLMGYMQLGATDAAIEAGLRLKRQCRLHDGVFSLLWHNSNLTDPEQWRVFKTLLSG